MEGVGPSCNERFPRLKPWVRPSSFRWLAMSFHTATPAAQGGKSWHAAASSEFRLAFLNGAQRSVNRKVQGSNPCPGAKSDLKFREVRRPDPWPYILCTSFIHLDAGTDRYGALFSAMSSPRSPSSTVFSTTRPRSTSVARATDSRTRRGPGSSPCRQRWRPSQSLRWGISNWRSDEIGPELGNLRPAETGDFQTGLDTVVILSFAVPFGLHPLWAVALLVIVLIVFGVGRLPSIGGALGRGISEFRQSLRSDEPTKPDVPADSKKD